MSFEDQLGAIVSRLRAVQDQVQAIEDDLAVEKDKLTLLLRDVKLLQQEQRPQS
jgi:hypothetical protein